MYCSSSIENNIFYIKLWNLELDINSVQPDILVYPFLSQINAFDVHCNGKKCVTHFGVSTKQNGTSVCVTYEYKLTSQQSLCASFFFLLSIRFFSDFSSPRTRNVLILDSGKLSQTTLSQPCAILKMANRLSFR